MKPQPVYVFFLVEVQECEIFTVYVHFSEKI